MRCAFEMRKNNQVLEIQLEAELNNAWVVSTQELSKVGVIKASTNTTKVSVVKDVEEFATELQAEAFTDFEIADSRHVPILQART